MISIKYTSPLDTEMSFSGAQKYVSTNNLFGFANNVILSQSPGSSFGTLREIYQRPQQFTVELVLTGTGSEIANTRSNLGAVLAEKDGSTEGYITITTENAKKRLYCSVLDYYPSHSLGEGKKYQKVVIEFIASCGFFVSDDGEVSSGALAVSSNGYTLPGTLPMSTIQYGGVYSITNDGDVACPMKIYIHGQTYPPKVVTVKPFACKEWIYTTEDLFVNTDPQDLDVVITKLGVTDVNGFYKTMPNTQYPLLPPGTSDVEVWLEKIDTNTTLELRWTPYYASI